jgi:hypothetical protein
VRRGVVWLLVLPLVAASWLSAHWAAYRLVPPTGDEHGHLRDSSEHAAFLVTPFLLAFAVALLLAGVVLSAAGGLRGQRHSPPPFRLVALVPAAGFTLQEHLEHLLGTGALPWNLVAEPTFVTGLALQLPFALAALLLAHALLVLGHRLGRAVARFCAVVPSAFVRLRALTRLPQDPLLPAPSALALGHGQRAPPAGSFP